MDSLHHKNRRVLLLKLYCPSLNGLVMQIAQGTPSVQAIHMPLQSIIDDAQNDRIYPIKNTPHQHLPRNQVVV